MKKKQSRDIGNIWNKTEDEGKNKHNNKYKAKNAT